MALRKPIYRFIFLKFEISILLLNVLLNNNSISDKQIYMTYDVIIIGAGPAGSAAAYDLADAGLKVLIIDRVNFPREKPCAGGLTPKAVKLFRYDISSMIKKQCRFVNISTPGMNSVNTFGNDILCYMTQRKDLDAFCLEKAIKKGCIFKVNGKIVSIEEKKTHVIIKALKETIKANYLIGSDGVNSIVRRSLVQSFPIMRCFAVEMDVYTKNPFQYCMEFKFIPEKKSYYWLFPRDDHVNIGIYTSSPSKGRSLLNKTNLKKWADYKLNSYTPDPGSIKGYPLGTGGWRYRVKSDRIFLTGDAAGFCENFFGEGIFHAVKSGQYAAQAIIKAFNTGANAGKEYQKKIRVIQKDLLISRAGSQLFYKFHKPSLKLFSIPLIQQQAGRIFCQR